MAMYRKCIWVLLLAAAALRGDALKVTEPEDASEENATEEDPQNAWQGDGYDPKMDFFVQAEATDGRPHHLEMLTEVAEHQSSMPHAMPQRELLSLDKPEDRLRKILPIAWVHVPKCGSSFANVLIDMPGLCPNIPKDIIINRTAFGESHLGNFKAQYDPLGKGCGPKVFSKWGNHGGMGPPTSQERHGIDLDPVSKKRNKYAYLTEFQNHAMGMFRRPEQRIISGYHHDFHDYPRQKLGRPRDIRQYANVVQGCSVKMMTRNGDPCGSTHPARHSETKLALQRLRTGFVFVGITEKWEYSMCLFHTMFGGSCARSDFLDSRLGDNAQSKHHEYNLAEFGLKGYVDHADTKVYEMALRIFEVEKSLYGVNASSCLPCWQRAGIGFRG